MCFRARSCQQLQGYDVCNFDGAHSIDLVWGPEMAIVGCTEQSDLRRCELTDNWRLSLGTEPTPLMEVSGLDSYSGGSRLFIKRDDRYGLLLGGNKYRQLEFVLAEAVRQRADVLVATGAVQSNLVCAVAAVARQLGMECVFQHELRFENATPSSYFDNGNRLLLRALGADSAEPILLGDDEAAADRKLETICDRLVEEGRTPYPVFMGQASAKIGALGYVRCAKELLDQCKRLQIEPDYIFLPSGTGLTHAGLLCGLRLYGSDAEVVGICVRRPKDQQAQRLRMTILEVEKELDVLGLIDEKDIVVWDSSLGRGYGLADQDVSSAIRDFAKHGGCLLDPVYSGKCAAGMSDYLRSSTHKANSNCVFLHTGGSAALFAYREVLT